MIYNYTLFCLNCDNMEKGTSESKIATTKVCPSCGVGAMVDMWGHHKLIKGKPANNMKQRIYFIKEDGVNIAISTEEGNEIHSIFSTENVNSILEKFPEAKGKLYILVDGVEFKLD